MFGTISGGPVVNVLSTGVLTIPMMIRRGFNKAFAGGVEAAASSGGSIMPPVMGVAAFVLASLTSVPYSSVIIAAIIPALAYFLCLFLSAVFQSRKQNITAIGEITEEMHLDRQDFLNLFMIFGPIFVILFLLLTPKDAVGCGLLGGLFGAERTITADGCTVHSLSWFQEILRNAAGSAGAAGWWAVMFLLGLLFLDPEVRARPRKIVDGLSSAGVLISTLLRKGIVLRHFTAIHGMIDDISPMLSWFTLAVEASVPIIIWTRWRTFGITLACLMHFGISFFSIAP